MLVLNFQQKMIPNPEVKEEPLRRPTSVSKYQLNIIIHKVSDNNFEVNKNTEEGYLIFKIV